MNRGTAAALGALLVGLSTPSAPSALGHGQEQHTHHATGSAGNECVACHMPQIETTMADVNVRSHTFKFIPPSMTDEYKIPNPCTSCHKDKTTSWARDTMRGWTNVSGWRIE